MPVSESDVHQAIWSCAKEGFMPRPSDIRTKLGNTGSFTTICKYLRTWEAEFMNKEVNPYSAMIENLNELAANLHSRCSKLSGENHKLKQKLKWAEQKLDKAGLLKDVGEGY